MPTTLLKIASRDALSVRHFNVQQALGSHFIVSAVAMSSNPSIDFDAVICQDAELSIDTGMPEHPTRVWNGLCSDVQQLTFAEASAAGAEAGDNALYAYSVQIVPRLWLLTQRSNFKIWQAESDPEIALGILKSWEIEPVVECDLASYPKRRYRCQHGESDFRFVKRLLEESGITFFYRPTREGMELVLSDALHAAGPRSPAIPFYDKPHTSGDRAEYATSIVARRRVAPAKYTVAEHDPRLPPDRDLKKTGVLGHAAEMSLESYDYQPGAFVFEQARRDTPVADVKGAFRYREDMAAQITRDRIAARRARASLVELTTNCLDLDAGTVVVLTGHQREPLLDRRVLVTNAVLRGDRHSFAKLQCSAVPIEPGQPYRPPLDTPKPIADGVLSATVVGPPGEEIHCDEFGRVRVQFHFDRDHSFDEESSCWLHVSQPWAGTGYGMINLPRVGQEVLVEFLSGDPDRPVITGRYFTSIQRPPYTLPEHKTRSTWRSSSTGGTGGFNEIMFEDKAGHELVYIHAERDERVVVKRSADREVGGDQRVQVGGDRRLSVGAHEGTDVGGDSQHTTRGDHRVTVGHDYELACLGGKARIRVEKSDLELQAVRTVIEAKQELVFKVGKSTMTLGPNGAEITVGKARLSLGAESARVAFGESEVTLDAEGVVTEGPRVEVHERGAARKPERPQRPWQPAGAAPRKPAGSK